MAIWVDADACPNVIKEILFRAAERTQTPSRCGFRRRVTSARYGWRRVLMLPITRLSVSVNRAIW